jgi:hypothetical protein
LASLYFVTVGVLYLWGYWPTFNINILEYLDLSDIIKVTAYPVAITVVLLAISSVGGGGLGQWQTSKLDARFDNAHAHAVRTGSDTELKRFKRFGKRYVRILISIYIAIALLGLYLLVIDSVYAWSILPPVIALFIMKQMPENGFLHDRIDNELLRYVLRFAFVAIPVFSFGQGKMASKNIVDGTAYSFVASDSPSNSAKKPEERLRYIGHAGEHIFFYDPLAEGTVIAKIDDDKPLTIKRTAKRLSLSDIENMINRLKSLAHFSENR